MLPIGAVRLRIEQFPGSRVVCEGKQIADIIAAVSDIAPGLVWYAADVSTLGTQLIPNRNPAPAKLGSASEIIKRFRQVEQFETGVFIAVQNSISAPKFRDGGVWTEDETNADLCDGLVEIRAFDATFIEVLSSDRRLLERLSSQFGSSMDAFD